MEIGSVTALVARNLKSKCLHGRAPAEGSKGEFFLASSSFLSGG